ncbi:MAG TPA: TolC family protein, partial [Verrucomicrobiae bacterium]|nr:TolC family protein [Verrucomicrobiae bacterium]
MKTAIRFDEKRRMTQSSRTMRFCGLLLICLCAAASAPAQTKTPVPRKLSLEDCIEIALKHNLDVQIKRYSPEISAYALGASYGAYEPTFNLDIEHDYTQQAGGVDAQGRFFSGTRLEGETYSSDLQGILPWGTVYDLGISLIDQTTRRPGSGSMSLITNVFYDPINLTNVSFVSTNFPSLTTSSELFSANRVGLLSLRQPLLKNFWIDSTRLQILLDKKTLQSSELDLRYQVMTTVTAVEEAYYNLIYDQENIKVQQEAVALNNQQLAE